MKSTLKYLLLLTTLLTLVGWGPFSFLLPADSEQNIGSSAWYSHKIQAIKSQANNISMDVLKLSLRAYARARHHGLDNKQLLTIIDYKKPSSERRLWVIDMKYDKVLFNTWVSHGRNSGKLNATSFSNSSGSLKSSLGVFLTTNETYMGNNGYSLRLRGLEHGFNDNAYRRDIVMHGAWYASGDIAKRYGYLGRSWGCPAVSTDTIKPLVSAIKDNTLLVAYYPDRRWIKSSTFLSG